MISNRSTFSAEYTNRINSEQWHTLVNRLIRKRGCKCEICRRKDKPLEGHHLNYDRLGHERDSDVQIVCVDCHPKADQKRREKKSDEMEQKRIDAWATKCYGANWRDVYQYDSVVDCFYEWLGNR